MLAPFFKRGIKGDLNVRSITVTNHSTFQPFNHSTNYPSRLTPHPSCKSAFTLAEVLITLGIIGVVAALLLPNIIVNYQKKQTITGLKAFYSIFTNALKAAEADYGDRASWEPLTKEAYYNKYLKNYLNVVSEEQAKTWGSNYKALNGKEGRLSNIHTLVYVTPVHHLANGMDLFGPLRGPTELEFAVDINGIKKGPNVIGRDFFDFILRPNSMDIGFYNGWQSRKQLVETYCNKEVDSNFAGYGCFPLIYMDGWEIKKDVKW